MNLVTNTCYLCGETKPVGLFCKIKNRPLPYSNRCKACSAKRTSEYSKKNWPKRYAYNVAYRKKHWEEMRPVFRRYAAEYKARHPERVKEYTIRSADKIRIQKNGYAKNRRRNDISFRLSTNLRNRIYAALKRGCRSVSSVTLFGCSMEALKAHLEKQFKFGMTWDNYGKKGWHVDHIKPCVLFNLFDLEEQKKCFHYTNLQPLWWYENISKGGRFKPVAARPTIFKYEETNTN
jgi:hypothetical protein